MLPKVSLVLVSQSKPSTCYREKIVRENDEVFSYQEESDDFFGCKAQGFPPPNYYWTKMGTHNRTSSGPEMTLGQLSDLSGKRHISREANGTYVCTAYNDLGTIKTAVDLLVIYPPNCTLTKMGNAKTYAFKSNIKNGIIKTINSCHRLHRGNASSKLCS